ncbi:MAG TPA: Hpt domain-containing protein [Propionibacteriaceae bacterium]|nr:Hpt domain-containing protein [Propionibacteriaceae bacterium]
MPGLPQERQDQALEALRRIGVHARESNLARIGLLEEAVDAAADGWLDRSGRDRAAGMAHTIAGSAETFGFADITGPACELEDLFRADQLTPEQVETARTRIAGIRASLDAGPTQLGQ